MAVCLLNFFKVYPFYIQKLLYPLPNCFMHLKGMRGLCEGGGNCLKCLKRGWNRKEERGNKDFKKGGQLGQGVGTLKKRGTGTPLRTMLRFFAC